MQTHAYSKPAHTVRERERERERERKRKREGRLTPRLGRQAVWHMPGRQEMMIVGDASSLLASVSARCPWTRYGKGEAGACGGLSEPREDTGVWEMETTLTER